METAVYDMSFWKTSSVQTFGLSRKSDWINVALNKVLDESGIAVNTTDPMVLGILSLFRWFKNL